MNIKREILNVIKKNLVSVIENRDYQGLQSLYIAVDKGSGELSFNDESENTLKAVVIFDWIGKQEVLTDVIIMQALRDMLHMAKNENIFGSSNIYKPFTIYYTDETSSVNEELMRIADENEDDSVDSSEDILEKLDQEFDEFLEKLLKN